MISGIGYFNRPVFMGLALVITLNGCSLVRQQASRYPAADVKGIYATARANPERNPVILIHGFTGAKILRSADGATVWKRSSRVAEFADPVDPDLLPDRFPHLDVRQPDIPEQPAASPARPAA